MPISSYHVSPCEIWRLLSVAWRMYLLPLGKLTGFHSLSSPRFGGGFWTEWLISENQCLMLRMFGLVWLIGWFVVVWFSGGCWGWFFACSCFTFLSSYWKSTVQIHQMYFFLPFGSLTLVMMMYAWLIKWQLIKLLWLVVTYVILRLRKVLITIFFCEKQ